MTRLMVAPPFGFIASRELIGLLPVLCSVLQWSEASRVLRARFLAPTMTSADFYPFALFVTKQGAFTVCERTWTDLPG